MIPPTPEPTTVVAFCGFGLALAALALSAVNRRRRRADCAEAALRLDTLAGRVDALEARSAPGAPLVRTGATPTPSPDRTPVPVIRIDRVTPTVAGPTLIRVPDLSAATQGPSAPEQAATELGRRYAAIWGMADAGERPEAIARATGQPIGQVELILGLKRPRPTNRGPRTR